MSQHSLILLLGILFPLSVQAQSFPDPGFERGGAVYELDTGHSLMDFTARHLGFGRVRGTFNDYRAAAFFTLDDLQHSTFRVVVDIASLDTQHPGRDAHVQDVFFAAEDYPHMTFTSHSIEQRGDGYVMRGDLQIRDVTRSIEIPFQVITLDGQDHWQNRRIAFEGRFSLNRNDYNVIYDNQFWNSVVSDSIHIDISFGAYRYNALNEVFPWRKNSIGTVIRDGIEADGLEATVEHVRKLYAEERQDWNFGFRQFYRAGRALYQAGRLEQAAAVFNLALELLSEEAEAEQIADLHIALAEVELAQGQQAVAQSHLEQALEHDALHPAAFVLLRSME